MAEVLVEYTDVVLTVAERRYKAQACAAPVASGQWHGWLEFIDIDSGDALRSGRETTQPNKADTLYWATGLTAVYLEGALARALHPAVQPRPRAEPKPAFSAPSPDMIPDTPAPDSILNPFSVYRKGEALLRRQLAAFSGWHLVNIVRNYELSDLPTATLNALPAADLIDLIVAAVKQRNDRTLSY